MSVEARNLAVGVAALRRERRPVRHQHVAVDEVVGRVADEGVAAVRFGEQVGRVDDRAAAGGDVAAGHQFRRGEALGVWPRGPPCGPLDTPRLERADAVDLAGGAVVGNVERDGRHRQERIAAQVVVGQDDVPQVLAVGGREPVLPVVRREAVLSAAGRRFEAGGDVGMEADAAAAQRQRRPGPASAAR